MRTGTKIGLALIGLAWFAASSAISAQFIERAMNEQRIHDGFTNPHVYRGSTPTGIAECMRIAMPVGASLPGGRRKV